MTGQTLAVIRPVRQAVQQAVPANAAGAGPQDNAQAINEFQLDTTEIDTRPEPLMARFTLFALAGLMTFGIIWASVTHIDRIVNARGRISATAPNIMVQPLEAAIVRSITVRTGDVVRAGAILATLDPTFTQADVEQLKNRVASLDAVINRLEAEQAGRPYKPVGDDHAGYGMLQEAIWRERQTQFTANMRLFDERLQRAQANLFSRQQEREHLSERLKILREVEGMRNELEASKTGSRLNSLLAQDSRIEVGRNLARAENAIIEGRHEIEAIVAERDVFGRQWDSRTIEELVTKRNERDALSEQLVKARKRQDMVELRTPTDAVVLEIAPRSVGSIIKEAETLFKLVPLDSPLEVEAQLDAREFVRVAVGDDVRIKLDSYAYQEYGVIDGKVQVISSDAFNDNRSSDVSQGSFYKIRIGLTAVNLRNVPPDFRLIPGMPLSAEIKVGSRSVISYFLRPIFRGFNESFREP